MRSWHPSLTPPARRELERFILADLGVHPFATARACFGEAGSVYREVHRALRPGEEGENVARLRLWILADTAPLLAVSREPGSVPVIGAST